MAHLRSLLAASAWACLSAVPAHAIDFDCATARAPAEAAVCASPVLSNLDERMARFYGWLWAALDDQQRMSLRAEQRKFLSERAACGEDAICLRSAYLGRIEALSARLKQITELRIPPEARRALASVPAVRS